MEEYKVNNMKKCIILFVQPHVKIHSTSNTVYLVLVAYSEHPWVLVERENPLDDEAALFFLGTRQAMRAEQSGKR